MSSCLRIDTVMWPVHRLHTENIPLLSPDEILSHKGMKFLAYSLAVNICFPHHLHFRPCAFISFIVSMISDNKDPAIRLESKRNQRRTDQRQEDQK